MLNVTAKHTFPKSPLHEGTLEVVLDGRRLTEEEAPQPRLGGLGAADIAKYRASLLEAPVHR